MVPRRRAAPPRDRLTIAAGVSAALHLAILAALIITFPNRTPPEPPPTNAVSVVFEPGKKTATAPKTAIKQNQVAHEAAPRGRPSPTPRHTVQAAPPPAPLPRPEIKRPEPPHPVTPPKPVAPPRPKPPEPKPVPAAPKPPPALPKIKLPPPPPPAPTAPKTPAPVPAPVPRPSTIPDNEPAEVNLNMPPLPELAPMKLPEPPPLPPIPPTPQKAAPTRRSSQGRSSVFSQGMMMNGMSFNGGGSTSGGRTKGMNLQLPSSMQANPGSDLAIQGSPGKNWLSELQQWVNDRASYPEMAGEMGQQGSVTVRFTVDRAGHVISLMMVTPTGYALLDQSWLGLFRDADLPPLGADAKSNTVTVTATMHYQIIH
ncbi:MAG TPA: TonB family protein [Acidisoma sp.]|uniref:energy transducer TonB n=1 Tax=Acidisoma sp. TaxID=1872115 RepID=UPI002CB86914|nr:TonB family protein [Acidisoma sp.]HTI02709.1 TonB family protein [Acidisoma sp.]